VKPRPFEYFAPTTLKAAYELLQASGDEAKAMAGGQSLVPMMNLRLSSPSILIDIRKIEDLRGISRHGDMIRIGALTRHNEIAKSQLIATHAPLLTKAISHVAHIAVRNRGTFGGSCCHADPAAELPACCVLLGAVMQIGSLRGSREVSANDFFQGLFETAIAADELLLAVHIPVAQPDALFAFHELSRRQGDFALSGVAARARRSSQKWNTDWVAFGVSDRPEQLLSVKALFDGGSVDDCAQGLIAAAVAHDLPTDGAEDIVIRSRRVWTAELVDRCRKEFADCFSGRTL
jgi:carbon-monoxide dehydrogenase medium subunit